MKPSGAAAALVFSASCALAQTPITVQVVNDSGLSDSDVYLLLSGANVDVVPASGPAIAYPFSVSGISKTPAGTLVNTSGSLVTGGGTVAAASAPLSVVAGASGIAMAFASAAAPSGATVPTIPAGGTATLTIGLPNGSGAQTLTQPFSVTLPQGVTIASAASTGTCSASSVQLGPTQILVPAGTSLPANGCTIVVLVTSSTPGTVTATATYLQTTGANVAPPVAPLTVTASASPLAMAFAPATIAVGTPSTLTIYLPNAEDAAQTLSAPFVDVLPATIVTQSQNTGTCEGVTVAPTQVSLPAGAAIPPKGCTIVVQVASIASGGALSALAPATDAQGGPLSLVSPYSGQQRPVYQFTMSTVSSGNLFISYYTPVAYPPAPTVRAKYRFQPLEFSYSQFIVSNGDLTSIDFYGIPLTLATFAPGEATFKNRLDHVTYYTSTATLLQSFLNVSPDLRYAFLRTDGRTFDPSTDSMSDFARIVGPNQLAAPGTSPIHPPAQPPSGWSGPWPPGQGSPWPYPSFADYLDSLVAANYSFVESDSGVISAYTFDYTGTIGGNRAQGYTITLTGSTTAPAPLPSNATITLNLPPQASSNGGFDFAIYGVPQNCDTLVISGFTCVPATPAQGTTPANPGNVATLANSVYGWIQADVISALNFGYMNGKADRASNGVGQSGAWYGLPPVPYPFGAARSSNDGFYNLWAALMYNHSDAYGFAFSDRKGRPSPDIAFPVGGTLRIWILPDTRLDAPMAKVSQVQDASITVSWPAVVNADHYGVTWSPPYAGASATVAQTPGAPTVSYTIQNDLTPGTPYTIGVRAFNGDGSQASYAASVNARTTGTTPKATTGNAAATFGFNWTPPGAGAAPDLSIAGLPPLAYGGSGAYAVSPPVPITVGLAPSSAPMTVNGTPCAATRVCVTLSVAPAAISSGGAATLKLVLSNPSASTSLALPQGYSMPLPAGVTARPVGSQCTGVVVNPGNITIGAVTVSATSPSCTINATLTASAPGTYLIAAPPLTTDQGAGSGASGALAVSGGTSQVAQTIVPPSIAIGGQARLALTLSNVTASPIKLDLPFVDVMPAGVTIVPGSGTGSCSGASLTATQIVLPAGSTIPPSGCTIVVTITSSTPGTVVNTTGGLFTDATVYPTQSFPMELRAASGETIWSANYYLTFVGAPQRFSVGPCGPLDTCEGSGGTPTMPFDTPRAPNFLDRQGAPLAVTGGTGGLGPPFGAAAPTIGVSFTPEANKKAAAVVYPGLGSMQESEPMPGTCRKPQAPGMKCP